MRPRRPWKNVIDADAGVDAALLRGRHEGLRVGGILERHEGAAANGKVKLLGVGESGQQNNGSRGENRREPSQMNPLFDSGSVQ